MAEKSKSDETQILNTDADDTRVMDAGSDDAKDAETDSDLPELNFDPAQEPSAFDPRVTGESTDKIELPAQPPSSWDEVNPFEDAQQLGPETASCPGAQQPGEQGTPSNTELPLEGTGKEEAAPAKRSVKFGLLTWSLIMIVIGVAIIAMPWWLLIDWPFVGIIAFAAMGTFMLVIALIALLSEKKREND